MKEHLRKKSLLSFFLFPRILLRFFRTYRRYLICGSAGFLIFLGQYPLTWLIAFYLGVAIIMHCCQRSDGVILPPTHYAALRRPFLKGFYFAMGFFVPSFYWLAHSFSIYAAFDNILFFVALSLVGVLGLSALVSSFFGVGFVLSLCFPAGFARLFAVVGFFALADYLRGYVFTGFPWNSFGYVWGASDALMQVASVIGVEGVGVLALLFAALSSCFFSIRVCKATLSLSFISVLLLIVAQTWGHYRIEQLTAEADSRHDIGFRLIQPNIKQDKKWDAYMLSQNVGLMLHLSTIERPSWVRHVLWPETAAPFIFLDSATAKKATQSITPEGGTISLGSPRRDPKKERVYYNSLLTLDKNGELISHYDKQHLVPFGEYTPLGIFALERIIGRLGAYSPQTALQPLLDTTYFPPALVAVCYEILFPSALRTTYLDNASNKRPQWLLNVSNDAWFGEISLAPYQHMSMSKWRSVELGLPLVRVNNTGLSGVVDALGRTIAERQVGHTGVIDFKLPFALSSPTLYTGIGVWGVFALLLLVFVMAFLVLCMANLQKTWQKERSSLS